jgi:hypothetical protein
LIATSQITTGADQNLHLAAADRLTCLRADPANLALGFPTRKELAARYAEISGRDLSELDFFTALGYWKLAIILEGVYARTAAGGYGQPGSGSGFEVFPRLVGRLARDRLRLGRKPLIEPDLLAGLRAFWEGRSV